MRFMPSSPKRNVWNTVNPHKPTLGHPFCFDSCTCIACLTRMGIHRRKAQFTDHVDQYTDARVGPTPCLLLMQINRCRGGETHTMCGDGQPKMFKVASVFIDFLPDTEWAARASFQHAHTLYKPKPTCTSDNFSSRLTGR
jgi:hypothetical protein